MEKLNLRSLNVNSAKAYTFHIIPKDLISNPVFDSIDYGSKLLYSMMLSRASLSATKPDEYTDKDGSVYIIYTIEQVMEDMRCARQTAVNMLKQLDDIGLIEKKRRGQGKPSLIYVKDFSTINTELSTKNKTADFNKSKKQTSENLKNRLDEVQKIDRSNTNRNQNEYNENDMNNQSITPAKTRPPTPPVNDRLIDNTYNPKIKEEQITDEQINKVVGELQIEQLKRKYPHNTKNLDEILKIIISVLKSNRKEYKISDEIIPAADIKNSFIQLDSGHIEYLLASLKNTTTQIKNIRNYLIKALMNATTTINNHYTQQVNHDLENTIFRK